jgi:hypothetical protein
MNNLLDFAGLLLYYIVLPLLLPVQALMYALAGLWFVFIYFHRMVMELPQLFGWLRTTAGKVHVPALRRKLVKVHA